MVFWSHVVALIEILPNRFLHLFQPVNDLAIVVSCGQIYSMDLFTFPPFLPPPSLPSCFPACLKPPVPFVSVFNIAFFPHEVCCGICDPWWCAAIIGSAIAISSSYCLFQMFAFFNLQRRCNGKGNNVSNLLLLHLVIGLMKVASHSQPIRLL